MKYAVILVTAAYLALTTPFFAQHSEPLTKRSQENKRSPIDILSDTKGFDMTPYLNHVVEKIRTKWYEQIPDVARPPVAQRGNVSIKFRVMKDGHVNEVKYDANSGDERLDRAAYGAVTASDPLLPLPGKFECQYIDLRFHFYYNPRPGDVPGKSSHDVLPCVTSKIKFNEEAVVTVSPSSVRVAVGAKQQFHAMHAAATDSAFTWSLAGPGCNGSTCGNISADGLYTAPSKVPNPATISVTATVTTTPSERAAGTVTIVHTGDSR
jgi:TonB family protein